MQIPGYSIHEEIGRGGMSTVYRAVQESLQREVALKVLSPELSQDKEYCEQLINEGKTVAMLVHPNIVTIYDLGVHEGRYYLSMEYVRSGSLRELLDKEAVDHSEALRMFKELANILSYAHEQGVVHMDIKPRNVLLRPNGELVLTDFGISKNMLAEEELDTPSFFHASPKYMSPEQIRGKDLDKRTDMYSLGIILYEMLTGKVPFLAKDAMGIARKHLSAPIPPLPDQYNQYQQLLTRLLAKDPVDRLPDMERVLETLEWIGGKRPDEVGGDTDRLSRDELLSELDENEEVMSIELADDGETTVAINSALSGLDFQTAFQQEVDLDDELNANFDEQQEDPLLATAPSLEAPTIELTAEESLSVPKQRITFPELDEIEIEPLIAKGQDSKVWTRLFLPLGVLIVGIYVAVASILPEQNARQAEISPELQEIMSTAKQLETLTRSLEERLAQDQRLNQPRQIEAEVIATTQLSDPVQQQAPMSAAQEGIGQVPKPSTSSVNTVLATLPVKEGVLQEMIYNEEKIQQLALEKRRLQDEIAELEKVASSAAVIETPDSVAATTSNNVQAPNTGFDINALPLAKTEKIPSLDESNVVLTVAADVVEDSNVGVSEAESTLIASVEYKPLREQEQAAYTTNTQPESLSTSAEPNVVLAENYVDEMRQEVADNLVDESGVDVAIVSDSLLAGIDGQSSSEGVDIDLGVMLEGEMIVIDPTLEQRLKQYASKVDRLGDGRIRVVLDQQDLYEPDSPELDVAARKLLDRLSYVFRNYSGFSISVIDRTAQNGSLANRNLSWSRARSASTYLVAQGMEAPRIQHRGNSVGDRNTNLRGLELILEPMI